MNEDLTRKLARKVAVILLLITALVLFNRVIDHFEEKKRDAQMVEIWEAIADLRDVAETEQDPLTRFSIDDWERHNK